MYLLYIDDSKKIHIGCAMGGEQKVGQVCVDMCIHYVYVVYWMLSVWGGISK